MRLKAPRVEPLDEAEWSEEQRELLTKHQPARVLNIFRTLVRHPALYRKWSSFGAQIFRSTLDARARELLILRIGHLCNAGYEFHQHAAIAKRIGMSDREIERIRLGPDAPEWDPFERTLLCAADELHCDQFISDGTWAELGKRYDEKQIIDLIFTVGQYTLVSMALNSLGVQVEHESHE